MKVHDAGNGQLYFWCPGCNETHSVSIDPERARENRDGSRPCWQWNGDTEKPTLSPSVNYVGSCHFHVREGRIEYQGDCTHALAGQTVDLPEWKDEWR
jgi:hypothetical protein